MSRRTTGTILLIISAFLYGVRYVSAAIFGSGVNSWNENLFHAMLGYIGNGPKILSILALIAGLFYLIWAELEGVNKKAMLDKIKDNLKND